MIMVIVVHNAATGAAADDDHRVASRADLLASLSTGVI